tara:strand:+ start:1348 stop:1506 length:159 start_codon:yes stop_codon:yes gene_type:complete
MFIIGMRNFFWGVALRELIVFYYYYHLSLLSSYLSLSLSLSLSQRGHDKREK